MTNEQLASLLAAYHLIVVNIHKMLNDDRAVDARDLTEHLAVQLRKEIRTLRNEQTIGP